MLTRAPTDRGEQHKLVSGGERIGRLTGPLVHESPPNPRRRNPQLVDGGSDRGPVRDLQLERPGGRGAGRPVSAQSAVEPNLDSHLSLRGRHPAEP